ncbi:DUF3800 domain-containing protein [Sorangium sp. So ce1153]|uniref:DUF3800 domain-containing protein n=1 Tax=Sorangium sp. So ce1153 TaxID=3133333 RepID=UPI003F5F2782
MAGSFKVYIDESGDEGFRFDRGSSEWFVLSAVITRAEYDIPTVQLLDEVRTIIGRKPKQQLHFRDLKHHHRIPYVSKIASGRLRTVNILVHKPSLSSATFAEGRLYFYTARYIVERISWFCRDMRLPGDSGDGIADITFSNKSGMSYDDFRSYMRNLRDANKSGYSSNSVHWAAIDPDRIEAQPHAKRMGLQIADAVASSFYAALEPKYGFIEDRYAKILQPVVYAYKYPDGREKQYNYGFKLWPREAEAVAESNKLLEWIRVYKNVTSRSPAQGSHP